MHVVAARLLVVQLIFVSLAPSWLTPEQLSSMRTDGRGYPDRASATGGAADSVATGTLDLGEHEKE